MIQIKFYILQLFSNDRAYMGKR